MWPLVKFQYTLYSEHLRCSVPYSTAKKKSAVKRRVGTWKSITVLATRCWWVVDECWRGEDRPVLDIHVSYALYTVYIVHCTLYSVQCKVNTMYLVQCTIYIIQCIVYTIY